MPIKPTPDFWGLLGKSECKIFHECFLFWLHVKMVIFVLNTCLKSVSPVSLTFLKRHQTTGTCICISHFISIGPHCSVGSMSCLKNLEWLVPAFLGHWVQWVQTLSGRRRDNVLKWPPGESLSRQPTNLLGRKFAGQSYSLSKNWCICFPKVTSRKEGLLCVWIFRYLGKSLNYLVQSKTKQNIGSASF